MNWHRLVVNHSAAANDSSSLIDSICVELARSPIASEWHASMESAARILDELAIAIEDGTTGRSPEEIASYARRTAARARLIVKLYDAASDGKSTPEESVE